MTQHRQISVDLVEVQEAMASVHADTDQGLRPGLENAANKIQHGVRFGRSSPSGEADAARRALAAALTRHQENSQRHIATAEQLVSDLRQTISDYMDVEKLAGTAISAIEETANDWLYLKSETRKGSLS